MAQTITNQARLNYRYNDQSASVLSNIATATLNDPLTADKNSVESTYRPGDELTFAVSFVNSGAGALTDIIVSDDLGTYSFGNTQLTPLDFTPPAIYYVNGAYAGTLSYTTAADNVKFALPSVAAGANVVIIYKGLVNENAPLEVGALITNTVTITAEGITSQVTASNTVTAEEYADVRITKSMTPSNIIDGSPITYEFNIFNYGNTEATNIVLTDQFDPAPSNITVQINGDTIDSDEYTYAGGLLTLPAGGGAALSLPAAVYARDPESGEITVVPSTLNITVTGII